MALFQVQCMHRCAMALFQDQYMCRRAVALFHGSVHVSLRHGPLPGVSACGQCMCRSVHMSSCHGPLPGVSACVVMPWSSSRGHGVDVREGKDVKLDCRFNNPAIPQAGGKRKLYWMRERDVVAIDDTPFDTNYKVELQPDDGRYDLIISRATYERDNGMFECRVKEAGTGADLHSTTVNLTVLIPPGSPRVTPETPKVTEGDNIDLICSSRGGSPDPQINWYRKGSEAKLNSVLKPGGGRDTPTTSVLTLQPGKDDDGAQYRCVVWNRASENEKMESIVTLNVEYYPRITIGPANPLKVELGSTLSMNCHADAKPPVSNVRWTRAGRFLETKNTFSKMNVEMDDAGRYICLADNGLGVTKEEEITVDVLYRPRVSVITSKDVDEGEDIFISCNVSASPPPITIEWRKLDDDNFRQNGEFLSLDRVTAANQGNYVCRAVNILNPTGGEASERIGNATVAVRVRHAPGKTYIMPAEPIAIQDESTTLTCGSNPPGWPTPTYRWWRGDTDATLTLGANYTIPRASLGDEGTYYCQPSNRLGKGTPASVPVKVYQPPRILEGLAESAVFPIGKTDISLTCRAQGKPLPSIQWLKDEEEIKTTDGLYQILVDQASHGQNDVHTLETSLMFQGADRINENQLMPQDRGTYECVFKNAVRELSSTQQMKVKHAPITVHMANKVAFDVNDDAVIECRMQSFPAPTFQWYRGSNLLTDDGIKFFTNDSTLPEDIYASVLSIQNIAEDDYDQYICKGTNNMGDHKTIIALKPKGPPEYPTNLYVVRMGTDYCELGWDDGFDGGIETIYQVQAISEDGIQLDHDCQDNNPCVISELQQQTNYIFKVKAMNTKGESDFSDPKEATTLLDVSSIPEPVDVFYESKGNLLSFRVLESNLELEGFVETLPSGSTDWLTNPTPILLNRLDSSHKEIPLGGEHFDDIRIKLCSKGSTDTCGSYMFAQKVDTLPSHAGAGQATSYTVIIVIVVLVCLAAIVIAVICFCCRRKNAKLKKKHQEIEVAHRGVNSQAPPPPYYTVGLDNKALDGSNDTGLDDPGKTAIYSQQQYNNCPINSYNNNGVSNGYMDNSYSNSNNGGSVNSQDSLWQVKGPASTEQQMNNGPDPRHYQYDPMLHGGYAISGYDDYSHYPPTNQSHPGHDEYGQRPMYSANGDPYAAVQKPGNNMDHIDGVYDVSGHPDPYMSNSGHHGPPIEMMPPDNRPQIISFDESLESGYSTPNSRNRRIIREIIV
ncbi:unnamed protein product, partial [Meganyctiphanes norvegica]